MYYCPYMIDTEIEFLTKIRCEELPGYDQWLDEMEAKDPDWAAGINPNRHDNDDVTF